MAEKLSMVRLLGFHDFFPNESAKSKEHYGNFLGREFIQKYCCYFLSYFRHKNIPKPEQLLAEWFTFYDHRYLQSPTYYFIEHEYRRILLHSPSQEHALISVESLLNTFIWSLKADIPETVEKFDPSLSLRLLELTLLFNDDVLTNYAKVTESLKDLHDDRFIQRQIFTGTFPQSDLINIDYAQLFYTQIYKLARLLDFLFETSKYMAIAERLITEFGCESKEEFLRSVYAAVLLPLKSREPSWSVLQINKDDENKEKSLKILETLSISPDAKIQPEQNDYLVLRNKPFQQLSPSDYRVVFDLFLIKKLYNGMVFKLSSYDKDFLSNIRSDFSEEVLVYEMLNNTLPANGIKIPGKQFKCIGLEREPDYYYRKDNDIILFESKDFFIKAEAKLSYDFNKIQNELRLDGRLLKAVQQLKKNIERCIEKQMPIGDNFDADKIKIFPVIVVHDSLYSAPGFNFWIHFWLLDELETLKADEKYKGFDFDRIAPLTIVEIDTLILYQQQFLTGTFDLLGLIRHFHRYVLYPAKGRLPAEFVEQHALTSALSFSEYVRELAHRNHIEIDFRFVSGLLKDQGIE